jgi:hypothetical protein
VGFDGPSADPVDSVDYQLHQMWLGAGKIIIENLTGLAEMPARCRIVVAPLKVRVANGEPALASVIVVHPGASRTPISYSAWIALAWPGLGLLMVLGLVLTRPDRVRAFGKAFDTSDH